MRIRVMVLIKSSKYLGLGQGLRGDKEVISSRLEGFGSE